MMKTLDELLKEAKNTGWTQEQAINLCCDIYKENTEPSGCYVALTGGCLYKSTNATRKDVDILFYRIRQVKSIDKPYLFDILSRIGISIIKDHGWCVKAEYQGKNIDMFFPDDDGDYEKTT